MTLRHKISDRITGWLLRAALCLALLPQLAACDNSFIFDYEGDCEPHYKVKFRYDWNLKFADAFHNEVKEVTLYVVDGDGRVVWCRHESGELLQQEGYVMDVDISPGTYTLMAWCGEGHRTDFHVPEAMQARELTCSLLRDRDTEGVAFVKKPLRRLFHGKLDQVTFPDEEGVHTVTLPLKKNTNDVHVVLQHLSGYRVEASKFRFEITDANGLMDWDNSLLDDEMITYGAYDVTEGSAGIIIPDSSSTASTRAEGQFSAAVASLSVGRLMEDNDVRLTVYNNETGKTVFSIPLVDYALLVKGNYGRPMDSQEYLDRQDEYNMTFFLDEGDRWINTYIYINSWKVLLQSAGI